MTIREIAIAKLQQLSEPLLQEVTDFIDFVIHKLKLLTVRLMKRLWKNGHNGLKLWIP